MKKRFIFLVMFFALLGGVNWNVLNAQETETITVGIKDNTDARIPVHTWYNYSYTQQIYTARDINHSAGDVLKIAFHGGYITNLDRKVKVYMLNTTKSYFESLSDWVAISESDLVYDGVLSTSSTLMEIELDKPFEYQGGNILLCLQDYTKQCPKSTSFEISYDYDGKDCTLLALDDRTQPGPDYLTGASHELAKLKNVLDITFSLNAGPVVPAAPVVNAEPTGQNTIYLSWNSVYKATSYNVYEGDNLIAEDITNTYFEVSGLTANTTYTYTVTAENEVGTSEKSNEASATTWPLAPSSAPANLKADNVDYSYVKLSWDAVTGAEYYTVYCNGSVLTEVDVTTYTVANLSEDTEYTFTVTASNISGTSPASEALTVKTAKFNGRIIVFELNDYYGSGYHDGWNGNKLKVEFNDGTPPVVYTNNNSAASEFYEIPVSYGTTVTVTYLNEGSYGSENTYYIRYKDDNYLIHADGRALTDQIPSTEPYSFIIELPAVQNLTATPAQIQKGQSTTISWEAYEGAATYNIYVNDELKGNTAELTYQLSEIPVENVIAVVAVDANGDEISGTARISVKVAGTFTLKLHVVNAEGVAIEGATVSFDTESFYNEFYELVPAIESMTTGSDGMIDIELPIPCKYGSPQWQYSSLGAFVTKEFYQTEEYWITSDIEVNDGGIIESDIILELTAPAALTAEDDELLAGNDLELSWDAVTGAIGYNVYRQGEWNDETNSYDYVQLNDEMITGTAYTVEDVKYGMWVEYAVTAVYETLGESDVTTTPVSVTGMGGISGKVTDGTDAIEYASVKLEGEDEFGRKKTYTFVTDGDGKFSGDMLVGDYTATVSHYDYNNVVVLEGIEISYQEGFEFNEDIVLTAKPSVEDITVTATDNGDYANVKWTGSYEKYNVYRRNIEDPQEVELLGEATASPYTDNEWAELKDGTYQYGVSTFVEEQAQSRGGEEVIYKEDFNNCGTFGSADWKILGSGGCINNYGYVYSGYGYYLGGTIGTSTLTSKINIDLTKCNGNITLKFYNFNGKAQSGIITKVNVKKTNENTWTTLKTISDTHTQFMLIEVDLSNYRGETIVLQFEAQSTSYGYSCIDEISIVSQHSAVESQIVWSDNLTKQVPATFVGGDSENPTAWNVAANWSTGKVPAAGADVIINANAVISSEVNVKSLTINKGVYPYNSLTVANNGTLTVTGAINQSNYQLVLEEGGQIFQNNEGVTARFRMNIDNPTEWSNTNTDGWQFISMPLLDVDYAAFASTWNQTTAQSTCDYDLYKYDGSQDNEWQNYRDGFTETTFKSGAGYLASRKEVETVTVSGTLNVANPFAIRQFSWKENGKLANLHLIGNPFTYNLNWDDVEQYSMVTGYAYVKANGDYEYKIDGEIKVGEGFFIQTSGTYASLAIQTRNLKEKANSINVIASGKAGKDNVVVNFAGQAEGFNKLQNFNDAIATVYVSENGKNYGIANVDENTTEVALNFDAKEMGNYTISLDVNGEFETVTLVDRFTGVETNMLLEDEYTFTATSNDNVNRFVIKLANGQEPTANSQFVYQSGEELILSIEGSVQIVDMLGRVVYYNEHANGDNRINVAEFNDAAYVVRVVNEEGVKTQKVVIY